MQALTNAAAYEAQYHASASDLQSIGDVNGDHVFNNADLQALLNLLKSGGGSESASDSTELSHLRRQQHLGAASSEDSNPPAASSDTIRNIAARILSTNIAPNSDPLKSIFPRVSLTNSSESVEPIKSKLPSNQPLLFAANISSSDHHKHSPGTADNSPVDQPLAAAINLDISSSA